MIHNFDPPLSNKDFKTLWDKGGSKQLRRNYIINSLFDLEDQIESDIERFIVYFGGFINYTKLPQSNYYYTELDTFNILELKAGSITVQTYPFDSYESLSDFILEKINNYHIFVYTYYINPDNNSHVIRAKFLDKKINLYK